MWGTVLFFGGVSAIEMQRIGIAAILIGLPRPMRNLFAFWVGLMISGSVLALLGATLLHDYVTPISHFLAGIGAYLAAPPIKILLGVLSIAFGATLAARSPARRAAAVAVPVGGPIDLEPEPKAPTMFSRVSSAVRGQWSWETLLDKGSAKFAFGAGLLTSAPPVEFWGAVLAVLASGSQIGAQVGAFLLFMVVSYAVAEIPLVCHLVWPVRTRAVVMQLQGWLRGHQRQIFACISITVGLLMVGDAVNTLMTAAGQAR